MKSAVLFLVFNRPDTTRQVFEAIRAAKPPRLYVAADGPRTNRVGEAERCNQVRQIATNIDWPCELVTLFRDENMGCKNAVSSAISWFLEQEEEGIILEDDCLPSQSFFQYCDELLCHYRFDTRIGMIAGTNMEKTESKKENSYFFSRLVQIWGWATWRRAWATYDKDMVRWHDFQSQNGFGNLGIPKKIAEYVTPSFDQVSAGKIDTWDYQWSFSMISAGMLTVVPTVNMISNIGFGMDATHTTQGSDDSASRKIKETIFPITHPQFVMSNENYDLTKVKSKNILSFIKRFIR